MDDFDDAVRRIGKRHLWAKIDRTIAAVLLVVAAFLLLTGGLP